LVLAFLLDSSENCELLVLFSCGKIVNFPAITQPTARNGAMIFRTFSLMGRNPAVARQNQIYD
jgi:hypothetical protein